MNLAYEENAITEHPPVPEGRDLGAEVRRALAGRSWRAGGGILPPRLARQRANRPSPNSQEVYAREPIRKEVPHAR